MNLQLENGAYFQQQGLSRAAASTCERHPEELVTGFCASCLRERLAGLESQASTARRNSTSSTTSGFKSLFFKTNPNAPLRRCKSFSCGRGDGFSASFEPQRKSCDVRGRSTLWSLFNQDDQLRGGGDLLAAGEIEVEAECQNRGFPASGVAAPVLEAREEDDEEAEIRPADPELVVETTGEITREEEVEEEQPELKPMKDHIDLDSQSQAKKPPGKERKEIAGGFWTAASVFSKKLQKWRRKQKLKKQNSSKAGSGMPLEKPSSSRRFRDTQSEIAVDAFGRRSCDTDPRFSLDIGRISLDYSWDEPRASWDGYLIGNRAALSRVPPPMLSVMEDRPTAVVQRADGQIPVEEDSFIPGGTAQTRDYYLDSSSSQRRRRSLDRSNSVRKVSVEINDAKAVCTNARVSPAAAAKPPHGYNGIKLERDPRDLSSNSLRDDCSESFDSAYRDPCKGAQAKKSKGWSKKWSIWGFIHWRGGNKGGANNVVERSFSESWPELRRQGSNGKILRCNSNVSSRHSFSSSTGFGSMRRSSVETNGHGKKKRDEFVLERNRSARYSPSHGDNGLLRFYLTPMRGSRRNGGFGKSRNSSSQFFTRSMLQLY
ncbi:hypothetical protein J5N97_002433 [Dioscorea zingiberensis]|uniref:Uncharacterized protein n=1 Tax=Dioscorea zingiberensis TaxID=325984 RepID=A0A9D5HQE1_9LILI|nr:hypothetical protein J5N97_002433 [Dioscorea zingiberensis]